MIVGLILVSLAPFKKKQKVCVIIVVYKLFKIYINLFTVIPNLIYQTFEKLFSSNNIHDTRGDLNPFLLVNTYDV